MDASIVSLALTLATLAFLGLLAWGVLRFYRCLKRAAESAQQRAFEGLSVYSESADGRVNVVFHTYYGLITFVTQTEHRFWASPDDARLALWRLHRFNLTWGILAYAALLIPLLSYGNYLAQKRSIRKQTDRLVAHPSGHE